MKKTELILIAGGVTGIVMALFDLPLYRLVAPLFLLPLALLYLYLGFALFNDISLQKIFKAESYKSLGAWRLLTAIGTGFALSSVTVGVMFSVLNYPMARSLLVYGIAWAVIMIIVALVKNIKDKNRFYRKIILRCIIFAIIGVIFLLLPGHLPGTPL
jgi:putative Mn2+ efflux pump MntP